LSRRGVSVASLDDIVYHPKLGQITVKELVAQLVKEKKLEQQKKRRALVDERKMLFMCAEWLYDIYEDSVYFYAPAKGCRPDVYGIKNKCVDFYELKANYLTWNKGKIHDIPMQNIKYEYNFLRAYINNELKMPEDIEKYTFNFLVTPKTHSKIFSTKIILITNDYCRSFVERFNYGLYILKSRNLINAEIQSKMFNLTDKDAQKRLKFLEPYVKEINSYAKP